jgi:hypothetical protein
VVDRVEPVQATADEQRPILVTGIPRSGTSWVGKMLDASARVVYINEPLNPRRPPGRSPGVLSASVRHRFQYITDANESEFYQAFLDMLALDYHVLAELRASRSVFELVRLVKYWNSFFRGRLRRRRPLIDDPYAVFSIKWFIERLGCEAVVVVRHPAAGVSSRKRLGYKPDFAELLQQPLLVRDWLRPFQGEMVAALHQPGDIIRQGSLLWRMAYHVVRELSLRMERVHVVRYEDLSATPLAAFDALYAALHLPFTERASRRVLEVTGAEPRRRSRRGDRERAHSWSVSRHGLSRTAFRPLDSRAHSVEWKRELSRREIAQIRALTADVADFYYADEEWN